MHHGVLPTADRPVTGGALRAWHHAQALQAAGHEVVTLTRSQDMPGGYDSAQDLLLRAQAIAPDRVICVQLEEAAILGQLSVPMAVDLYAPRLLEAPFEGRLASAAVECLQAINAGSVFLVSNPRQRWAWLGVLALAGVDVRTDPTLHVPLVAPNGPPRQPPEQPVLVAGGAFWPWHNPTHGLQRVLAHLDQRGSGCVHWYGGTPLLGQSMVDAPQWQLPEHPRLHRMGWLPYPQLLNAYAHATAAIDWMAPNPERSLALSFRHMDYLGCGLPIFTSADSPLADVLGKAGMATDDIEGALDALLDHPKRLATAARAAKSLAKKRYSREIAEAALVDWVAKGTAHPVQPGPLMNMAAHAAAAAEANARCNALADALAVARRETSEKRAENSQLNTQIQQLTSTVARLTRAIDEVAGFKREAVAVLGGEASRAQQSLEEAQREITILRADLSKKSAELHAMDQLRARLENDLDNLRTELDREKDRGLLRRRR